MPKYAIQQAAIRSVCNS